MTLLKKLANSGFSGFSISKKAYNFFTNSSLSAKASLICDTSDVKSSQAVFEYLGKKISSTKFVLNDVYVSI